MHTVKISSKRQIALPKSILEVLGINIYDQVQIEAYKDSIKLTPVGGSVARRLAGSLAHLVSEDKKRVPFSKIMEVTKRKAAKKLASDGLN